MLANFSSYVRIPMVGFEEEIVSLLYKMDAMRGYGAKASERRGRQTFLSCKGDLGTAMLG